MIIPLAGRLTAALLAGLLAAPALAADVADRDGRVQTRRGPVGHNVYGPCGTPTRIVSQPYQEQICYGGAHGYAACRWVAREYVVRIPAECPREEAIDEAWPLPHRTPHGAKGLATRG